MSESRNSEIIAASRHRIWEELRKVARPDSRFHWDFAEFICDFEGSPACSDRVRALDAYATQAPIFITPDNSTEDLRMKAMADGKKILMTTYGIRRGFCSLTPRTSPRANTGMPRPWTAWTATPSPSRWLSCVTVLCSSCW